MAKPVRNIRRRAPKLETMETRVVMSVLAVLATTPHVHPTATPLPPAPTDTNNQVLFPTGTPTAREQRRLSFKASMTGSWQQGPGRFSTEAAQFYLLGAGTSTMFLHGSQQTRIIIPTDPTTPATGLMTLLDRNINNGAQLGLRLTAVPDAVDAHGRPNRFSYQVDQSVSGGTFISGLGSGTVRIYYGASNHAGRGPATMLVTGQVYSTGTTNVMINGQIN